MPYLNRPRKAWGYPVAPTGSRVFRAEQQRRPPVFDPWTVCWEDRDGNVGGVTLTESGSICANLYGQTEAGAKMRRAVPWRKVPKDVRDAALAQMKRWDESASLPQEPVAPPLNLFA